VCLQRCPLLLCLELSLLLPVLLGVLLLLLLPRAQLGFSC
jgi:hypothetical protein